MQNLDLKYHKVLGIFGFNHQHHQDFSGKCKEKTLDIYNLFLVKAVEQPFRPFLIFKSFW